MPIFVVTVETDTRNHLSLPSFYHLQIPFIFHVFITIYSKLGLLCCCRREFQRKTIKSDDRFAYEKKNDLID